MVERIRQLMQYKSLSASQFADGIEVPRAVISHILSERNKPSLDVVVKIISTFKEVSVNWLLLGEGQMLNDLATNVSGKVDKENHITETKAPSDETDVPASQENNLQKKESVSTSVPPFTNSNKAIERVMIFYSDHTFSSYSPE